MNKIYDILSKHFLEETSPEEERIIEEYKASHWIEYIFLKKIWQEKSLDLKVKDFDPIKALRKIEQQVSLTNRKPGKMIRIKLSLRKATAVAAVFIALISSVFFLIQTNQFNHLIEFEANTQVKGGQQILLEDGTKIWLNKHAVLSYPKSFTSQKRKIYLKGEAFFEVAPDSTRPFVVNLDNSKVTVLGTSFNIKNENENTLVTVASGKVRVNSLNSKDSALLVPGYTALVNNDELKHYKTKDKNYLAWKTGKFIFENTSIQEVIEALNNYYDIPIINQSHKNLDCQLTTKFNNTPIDEVIQLMELSCNLSIIKTNNCYQIH